MKHYISILLLISACVSNGSDLCEPPGTQVAQANAAGCILVDSEKLLMVRGHSGWSIPAGHIEAGETSQAAAVRETAEEAGVQAIAGPPICAVPSRGFVAHACVTPQSQPTPKPDGVEIQQARWMSQSELSALAPSELRFPGQRAMFLQVLDGASAAQRRLERGEAAPPQ